MRVRASARGDVSDELDVRGMRAQEAREAVRAFVDDAALAGPDRGSRRPRPRHRRAPRGGARGADAPHARRPPRVGLGRRRDARAPRLEGEDQPVEGVVGGDGQAVGRSPLAARRVDAERGCRHRLERRPHREAVRDADRPAARVEAGSRPKTAPPAPPIPQCRSSIAASRWPGGIRPKSPGRPSSAICSGGGFCSSPRPVVTRRATVIAIAATTPRAAGDAGRVTRSPAGEPTRGRPSRRG